MSFSSDIRRKTYRTEPAEAGKLWLDSGTSSLSCYDVSFLLTLPCCFLSVVVVVVVVAVVVVVGLMLL